MIFEGLGGVSVVKCDLCVRRLAQDQLPACAAGCPTHAIRYLSPAQVAAESRRKAAEGFLVALGRGERAEGAGA